VHNYGLVFSSLPSNWLTFVRIKNSQRRYASQQPSNYSAKNAITFQSNSKLTNFKLTYFFWSSFNSDLIYRTSIIRTTYGNYIFNKMSKFLIFERKLWQIKLSHEPNQLFGQHFIQIIDQI